LDDIVFRGTLSLEQGGAREGGQCGVGISISLDKLIAAAEGDEENEWASKGPVDAVICSLGHHPMAKEKIILMREFLSHGIHSSILGGSQVSIFKLRRGLINRASCQCTKYINSFSLST
jgi:hypothetical protein